MTPRTYEQLEQQLLALPKDTQFIMRVQDELFIIFMNNCRFDHKIMDAVYKNKKLKNLLDKINDKLNDIITKKCKNLLRKDMNRFSNLMLTIIENASKESEGEYLRMCNIVKKIYDHLDTIYNIDYINKNI